MEVSTTTAALVIVAVVVILFVFFNGCKKHHKDSFTRTSLTGAIQSGFVRSPVDYYSDALANPHAQGFLGDKALPLEYGLVDLLHDERLDDEGKIWDAWKSTYNGSGNGQRYIHNDSKTRHEMAAIGDMTAYAFLNDADPGADVTDELDEYSAAFRADPDQRRDWGTGPFDQESKRQLKAAVARGNCMVSCHPDDERCLEHCARKHAHFRDWDECAEMRHELRHKHHDRRGHEEDHHVHHGHHEHDE